MFVHVDPHFDYNVWFCGYWNLNVTVLELEYKELFCIAFIGQEQTIYGLTNNDKVTIKKLPLQNFHDLSFISKQSFICCGSFINVIVAAVFINFSSSWQHHYRGHIC